MIGNWLSYENGYTQLDLSDFAEIDNGNMLEYLEFIPLTEQWLLDFGFEKSSDFFAKRHGVNGLEIIVYNPNMQFEFQLGKGRNKVLKHVHQLQNLYFALTGNKLEKV